MKRKFYLSILALSLILIVGKTSAQSVFQTHSASIHPSVFYIEDDSEVYTVITWNKTSKLVEVYVKVWDYSFELIEDEDFRLVEIDEFTSFFKFIEEDGFKKKIGAEKFFEPFYVIFYFDTGEPAVMTIHPQIDAQYGVMFWVSDDSGNSIDDAIITFDGFTFAPGTFDLGLYYPGMYAYSIRKEAYQTIEGELLVEDSPISESFVMYPLITNCTVSFHIVHQGTSVVNALIMIEGPEQELNTDQNGRASSTLDFGTYSFSVVAEGFEFYEGEFELHEEEQEVQVELLIATAISDLRPLELQVFPSPAKDIITVSLGSFDENSISIYSMNGKLLYSRVSSESSFILDVKHLPSGIYLLRVQAGDKQKALRFVKQ